MSRLARQICAPANLGHSVLLANPMARLGLRLGGRAGDGKRPCRQKK